MCVFSFSCHSVRSSTCCQIRILPEISLTCTVTVQGPPSLGLSPLAWQTPGADLKLSLSPRRGGSFRGLFWLPYDEVIEIDIEHAGDRTQRTDAPLLPAVLDFTEELR
jgi:hypothetical protein